MTQEKETAAAEVNGHSVKNMPEKNMPEFRCLGQALRDMSVECPIAAWELEGTPQFDMNLGVRVGQRKSDASIWDVALSLRLIIKQKEATACVVELSYSGTFFVKNITPEQCQQVLHVDAALLLFPFARQLAMSQLTHCGYQPPVLDPVNFMALYMQHKKKAQGAAAPAEKA